MRLVLKLPKDKPPFIGIQFGSLYEAGRTNAEVLFMLEGRPCTLVLEPQDKHSLNLHLKCVDVVLSRIYKNIDYNAEKLRAWFHLAASQKQINFGHVIMQNDNHKIVKAGQSDKNFVVKVERVKITTRDEFIP